jgi:hypothetical protein
MGHRGRDNYMCDKKHSVHAIMKSLTNMVSEIWLDGLVSLVMFSTRCVHLILCCPCLLPSELLLAVADRFQALLKLNTDHLELQIQVATANQFMQTRPKTTMLIYAQLSAMSCAFQNPALFKALTVL